MRLTPARVLGAALLSCLACAGPGHAQSSARSFTVAPELWDRPRSGAAVMEQPAIRQAVAAWLAQPGASLLVHHGPGQDGYEQAEELRAWLLALALERVLLRNDPAAGRALRIEVLND